MKISTKGRYGLRALLDLTVHSGGEHVPLKSIAERQAISENYLEQVFSTLRKAGLVKSVKGAQGGYILADRPEHISVGMILRALEGDLSVIHDNSGVLSPVEHCIQDHVWNQLNQVINSLVDTLTLDELADEYHKANDQDSLMFYI